MDSDHAEPVRKGGKSDLDNASGLCARCNQIKENRGWRHDGNLDQLTITTPTKHTYTTQPGPLIPGYRPYTSPDPPDEQDPDTPPERFSAFPRHRPNRLSISQYLRC